MWSATTQALGALGATEITDALVAALGVDEQDIQQDASSALGLMGDPSAITPLIDLLERSAARGDYASYFVPWSVADAL